MSPLIIDSISRKRSSTNSPRSFVVSSAKFEDVRRLVDIEFHAFENEQVNQVLSYRDYKKPAHFERSVRIYEQALCEDTVRSRPMNGHRRSRSDSKIEAEGSNATVAFKKITDADTGEIVSFAKIEVKTYGATELLSPADSGHEGESKMNRDWFALNERLRREYVRTGRHCYIGMLATQPKHQHNGAGTMLLEEILSEADRECMEVYLEATDTAKPLYEKHGFKTITELRFSPAEYGVKGLGVERQTAMVRAAPVGRGE